MTERIVYQFEMEQNHHVKLVADGLITKGTIAALESYIRRQKQRLKKERGSDCSEPLSRPA